MHEVTDFHSIIWWNNLAICDTLKNYVVPVFMVRDICNIYNEKYEKKNRD